LGFVFIGVPWYVGTFIFCCLTHDYRERSGLAACAIAVHEPLPLVPTTIAVPKCSILQNSEHHHNFSNFFFPQESLNFFGQKSLL
jgi:hypothetical protein